ncbi:MAG: hypothetical protein ABI459_11210 [Deltaproteobacteria bacterium]
MGEWDSFQIISVILAILALVVAMLGVRKYRKRASGNAVSVEGSDNATIAGGSVGFVESQGRSESNEVLVVNSRGSIVAGGNVDLSGRHAND